MLYNETNNFDEIKTLFPDKTEIEVVIRPCLPRADHRVPGGLILRKLMVCFPIIRFFPVLTKLQETFGGCDVFTATGWWEEANQAAAPGRRPTLEWQATWGQSTREKLFRWWLNLSLGIAQNFTPFRFSAGFILPRRVLWCKISKMRLFADLCPCSSWDLKQIEKHGGNW